MNTYDLSITGSWGFYTIRAQTPKGERWVKKHLSDGERSHDSEGNVLCDDGDYCREIVAAAVRGRLRVEVNGVDMKGYGQEHRA